MARPVEGLKSTSVTALGLRPRGGWMFVFAGGNDMCWGKELLESDDPDATSNAVETTPL